MKEELDNLEGLLLCVFWNTKQFPILMYLFCASIATPFFPTKMRINHSCVYQLSFSTVFLNCISRSALQ